MSMNDDRSFWGLLPDEGFLYKTIEVIGETYELTTDPQWDDWPNPLTVEALIEALVFYGVASEVKAEQMLTVWNETKGTVGEPLPDVLILNVLYGE